MADQLTRPSATSTVINAAVTTLTGASGSLTAMYGAMDLWKSTTLAIGNEWLHGGDPELANAIDNLNSTQALDNFFKTMDKYPLDSWSMDLITELQSKIAGNWDKDKSGMWNGQTSQQSSLIQATSGQNTAVGDSQARAAQSALQNASSAPESAKKTGDDVIGLLVSGANAQSGING